MPFQSVDKYVSEAVVNVCAVKSESLLCWLEARSRDGR